jgi:uncharacterized membrane protein
VMSLQAFRMLLTIRLCCLGVNAGMFSLIVSPLCV